MIFIFLSCREKAHDNKEFSRENSNHNPLSQPLKYPNSCGGTHLK